MSQDTNEPSSAAAPAEVLAKFAEFYRSHRLRLLRFVQAKGRLWGLSEAYLDAEGVVQETFTDILVKWATIQHPERLIYTVARRKIWRRSCQEWDQDRELRQHLETACSEKYGKNTAHIHAVANEVIKLMEDLPPNQRSAAFLSGYLGWTGPEIAEFLDVALATAYVHVSRGIKSIRENGYEHSEDIFITHNVRWFCLVAVDADSVRLTALHSSTNWVLSRDFFELPWGIDPRADKIRPGGRGRLPGRRRRKKSPRSRRKKRQRKRQ